MHRKHYSMICGLAGILLIAQVSSLPASESFGVGVKAGTTGLGAEISTQLLPNTRLRGSFNYLQYSFDSTISDINYDFDPEFNSLSAFIDVHPFGGAFFLSGGLFFNNNNVEVTGTIDQSMVPPEFSEFAFLADMVSISGDVEFNPIAPYVGIGWRSNSKESGWGVAIDLGVMYQGAPDVKNLRVNAPIDVNGIDDVQAFLAEQESEIEDELSWFEFYPVATFMVNYHF